MNEILISYKDILMQSKPYPTKETASYLQSLEEDYGKIHAGETGIYLARRIDYRGQELFFPYIDIDGKSHGSETSQIQSALEERISSSVFCNGFRRCNILR